MDITVVALAFAAIFVVAALLFLGGAVFLFIEGRRHHGTASEDDGSEFAEKAKDGVGARGAAGTYVAPVHQAARPVLRRSRRLPRPGHPDVGRGVRLSGFI